MSLSLHPHIHARLITFDKRRLRFRWLKSLSLAAITLAVSICIVALCDYWFAPNGLIRWVLTSSAYAIAMLVFLLTCPVWRLFSSGNHTERLVKSAEWLEGKLPRLRHFLVAAVELGDGNADERSPHYSSSADFRDELQRRVAASLAQTRTHEVLPWNTMRHWFLAGTTAVILLALPMLFPRTFLGAFWLRALLPSANIARPASTMVYWVEPQSVQTIVPSNESIEVVARVAGIRPKNVFLSLDSGLNNTVLEMRKSSESTSGDLYSAIVPVAEVGISLRIFAGDGESIVIELKPQPRPSIDEYQVEYQLPDYANAPTRTLVSDHGNLLALEGSQAIVKMRANMPLSNVGIIHRTSAGVETTEFPYVRLATDLFQVQFPVGGDVRYRWQLRAIETGFDTPFAPWFKIQSIPDLPPRIQLFISSGHNGLYDAKEMVAFSGEIQDELEVDRTYLEYSINGLPWVVGPALQSTSSPESNASDYQIKLTVTHDWDLATLSLKDGDLVRARLVAADRKSQQSTSPPVQFLITELDFSADRYPLLSRRIELLRSIKTWRDASDPSSARLASDEVLGILLRLLAEKMERPDALELEALYQAIFVLGTLRRDSAPFTEAENAGREQVIKAARHFFARTVNEACARDTQKLLEHIVRIADNVERGDSNWLERQLRLAHEYFDASTGLIESTSADLSQSMVNNCDNLIRQLRDLQNRLDQQLDQEIKVDHLRAELKHQSDQLSYRVSNPHLDGSIPNLCMESLVELNRISQSNAVRLNELAKDLRQRDELRAKMLDARDASVIAELEELSVQEMQQVVERSSTLVEIHAARLIAHQARTDFSVGRVSDLQLITRVFDATLPKSLGDSVRAKVYESSSRDVLITAVHTLDVGNDVLELWSDLQQLARRERWETSVLVMRLGHPMQWDYLQKGLDLAVPSLQQVATMRELANVLNSIRYGEDSRSAAEQITQRRWDKNRKTKAADDLDRLLVQMREPMAQLQQVMEQAREDLRNLLPEEFASEMSLAAMAENDTEGRNDPMYRELADQSPEDALKALEEELKTDAEMRSSLDKISEENAKDAMEQLKLAAKQEEQLALQLEQNDPVLREQKRTAVARLSDLANRAQEILRHPLEQARSTASRGAANEVAKALEKPQEALRKATTAAQSVGEQRSMEAIQAAANEVVEALDDAAVGLASAAEEIVSLEGNEIEKRPQDRQRTKEQMESLERRTQDNAARDMGQRQKRWSELVQQRKRDVERTEKELTTAKKNMENAQAELAKHPNEEWREQQTRDAANQVRLSEEALAAMTQSVETLEGLRQAAAAEAQQTKDATTTPIEAANSAAALSHRLIDQTDQRVDQLKRDADALRSALSDVAGPELDQRSLESVKERQQRIQGQLAQVQENLERVARHEKRVGRVEAGEKFAEAAARVKGLSQQQVQQADNQSSAALETLDTRRLATESDKGKSVQQAVVEAQHAIETQAEALAAQIAQGNNGGEGADNGNSANGESDGDSAKGMSDSASAKKAMTLDDLDRALHAARNSSAIASQGSLEASPTLAAEGDRAKREAARQVLQSTGGNAKETGEPTDTPSAVSGTGVAGTPQQGDLAGDELKREAASKSEAKDDWWQLREQKADDVVEGQKRVLSEAYRKQIEAYFRGIAERSQP